MMSKYDMIAVRFSFLISGYWMMIFSIFPGCQNPVTEERIKVIIDADTANEVDDLFALARAIAEPKLEILGITSAQFHTSPLASDNTVLESQKMNEDIVHLMNVTDIKTPLGSTIPLNDPSIPMDSEASEFIISSAHSVSEGEILHIIILGPCTNVASAVIRDPSILPKIKVHYLGFWHDVKTNQYNKKEFNSGNDTIAVNVLLDETNLDLTIMTATTSQHLVFDKINVDKQLKGRGGIADYLVDRWESYQRWWTDKDLEKNHWIMWDVAIIEALIHPELTESDLFMTPEENVQRQIRIHTKLDEGKMEKQFWQSLETFLDQ